MTLYAFLAPAIASHWLPMRRAGYCTQKQHQQRLLWRACMDLDEAARQRVLAVPGTRRENYQWNGYDVSYLTNEYNLTTTNTSNTPTVVLVHGFGGSARHWRRVIPKLVSLKDPTPIRVLVPDLLGFGASSKPSIEYSIELWAEQVHDLIQRFIADNDRVILVGNSIGSLSCVYAASNLFPSSSEKVQISGLVLCNCAGGLTSFRVDELNLLQRFLLRLVNAVLFNRVVGGLIFRNVRKRKNLESILRTPGVYCNTDSVDDELLDLIAAPAYDDGALDVALAVFNADAGPKPEPMLSNLSCPILLIWGEDDALTPLRTGFHPGVSLAQLGEHIQLHVVENCGHCPMDDEPEQVLDQLLPFILQNSKVEYPKSKLTAQDGR